jgi:hypothetical protein
MRLGLRQADWRRSSRHIAASDLRTAQQVLDLRTQKLSGPTMSLPSLCDWRCRRRARRERM